MFISNLYKLLIPLNAKTSRSQRIFWFSLSMTFAVIYIILAWQQAFGSEYVIQDDARQHVFWMRRFLDANLFPNDLIADYFQSVSPVGYSTLYHAIVSLGVNPIFFNKLLPAILAIISTAYCFGISMRIFPLPITGFMATLIFNQTLWMKDDLSSGTPRAFAYPLMVAFLYYLLRKSLLPCLLTILLSGVFYPSCVLIYMGILILRLGDWQNGKFRLSQQRHQYLFSGIGLIVAFIVILPYVLKSSEFGPVITLAQAKQLPELLPSGRSAFFDHNHPLFYFFGGSRSGMFSRGVLTPVTLCAGMLLPLLVRYRAKFPLIQHLTTEILVLSQMLVTSIVLFIISHILLFKLYLPSRYTAYSFRIILAISAAIVLTTILDSVLSSASVPTQINTYARHLFAIIFTVFLTIALIFHYPCFIKNFPKSAYKTGNYPKLYEFFQQQPKDTLIASLAEEINNLPTFSQRSILAGREYAIPWHSGYYSKFRQRTTDLIQAYYSPNLADVKNLIQKYKVDFWLLESGSFTPEYIKKNQWLKQYINSDINQDELVQLTTDIFQRLQQGNVPALSKIASTCTVAKIQNFVVVDANCITSRGAMLAPKNL
ncbi:MAG: hypothetical protein QNJ47_25235 [Nostocaceae cyanobacterium]|nr:hypothetical protein [Nostocaceae cyanobacterium]